MKRVKVRDFDKNTSKMKAFSNVYRQIYGDIWALLHLDGSVSAQDLHELAIDPFARNCEWAYPHTNDINPETSAVHHVDALEFLNTYERNSFSIGLLDPPFSDRMAKDKYGSSNLYASDCQKMRQIEHALGNLIKHHGVIIKLGYNTSKPHPGFVLEDFEVWNLGGCRNDILCSIWRKVDMDIEEEWV